VAEHRSPPEECANCGAAIPRDARACPECGADERTGWRESSVYDGLELPDSAYADDDPPPAKSRTRSWIPVVITVLLIVVLVWSFVFRR
jgi:hypothetical protein